MLNKILNFTDDVGIFYEYVSSVSSESIKEKMYCLNSVCLEKSVIVSPDRQRKLDFEAFHKILKRTKTFFMYKDSLFSAELFSAFVFSRRILKSP